MADTALVIQAVVVAVAYVISSVSIFLIPVPGVLGVKFAVLGLTILFGMLAVYSVRCMVRGQCNVWAWIVACLMLVFAVIKLVVIVTMPKLAHQFVDIVDEPTQSKM
jgi:hypothetical protein